VVAGPKPRFSYRYVASVLLTVWVNNREAGRCAFLPVYNLAAQFNSLGKSSLFAFVLSVGVVASADFD
jgi:hypothetical protein